MLDGFYNDRPGHYTADLTTTTLEPDWDRDISSYISSDTTKAVHCQATLKMPLHVTVEVSYNGAGRYGPPVLIIGTNGAEVQEGTSGNGALPRRSSRI